MIQPGFRSGMLEVIELARSNARGNSWRCRCDCGNVIVKQESHLVKRDTRNPNVSCGCHHHRRDGIAVNKTARLYNIWRAMIRRCHVKKSTNFEFYGQKGIKVCDEWKNSVDKFISWSISNGYKDGLTLDRIDVSKGYDSDNCRWVTWSVQAQNKGVRKNNKTGHTGISAHGKGFRVGFSRDYKKYYVGYFKTLESAIEARDKAISKIELGEQ